MLILAICVLLNKYVFSIIVTDEFNGFYLFVFLKDSCIKFNKLLKLEILIIMSVYLKKLKHLSI